MYCPRCGHQPISNELRFCSYCGLRLGIVKASLAEEDDAAITTVSNVQPISITPRHRDINIGVVLMFLGSLLAILIAERAQLGREGGGLILTIWYAAILLLSAPIVKALHKLLSWGEPAAERLSTVRKEMGFGATMMFLSTLLSGLAALLTSGRMNTNTLSLSVLVAFGLLLVISPYLLRALRYLLRDDSITSLPAASPSAGLGGTQYEHAIPPAQEHPVSAIGPTRVTTAEIGVPVGSVTEHTTNLLSDK